MRSKKLFTALAALLTMAILVAPVSAGNGARDQVRLSFDKELVTPGVLGYWEGPYGGDASGDVTVTLVGLRETGAIWHVEFEWEVTGDVDLEAVVSGVLNTRTGHIALNGVVTSGDHSGAQVHVDAQLEFDDFGSHGVFRIMTGSAG
ncbi:MAG: hypothetical protein V3U52_04570 [Thermoplasmata archaeon]